jgi:hypothetical protein
LYKVVTDTEMFDSIAETLGIMWLAMGYSILASRFCFSYNRTSTPDIISNSRDSGIMWDGYAVIRFDLNASLICTLKRR